MLFTIARFGPGTTVVLTLLELFDGFVSHESSLTVAVFVIVVPGGTFDRTRATIVIDRMRADG